MIKSIEKDISKNAAIVYAKITELMKVYGIEKDGKRWLKASYEALENEIAPLSYKQIRLAIQKLIDANLLEKRWRLTGHHHDSSNWYALKGNPKTQQNEELELEKHIPNLDLPDDTTPKNFIDRIDESINSTNDIALPPNIESLEKIKNYLISHCKDIYYIYYINNISALYSYVKNKKEKINKKKENEMNSKPKSHRETSQLELMPEKSSQDKPKKPRRKKEYYTLREGALPDKPAIPPVLLRFREFEEYWIEFVEHRIEKGKPLTPRAAKMTMSKLCRMMSDGYSPVLILENSIANDWVGVFPSEHCKSKRSEMFFMPM